MNNFKSVERKLEASVVDSTVILNERSVTDAIRLPTDSWDSAVFRDPYMSFFHSILSTLASILSLMCFSDGCGAGKERTMG